VDASPPVPSPCINVCVLDAANVCRGCGRTIDEIAAWSTMSDAERREVLADLERRRERGERRE
jgi:predicted Fe-S protein YdhL (DUF1289 family)